uniref:Uncharacterized protein n=1 Tax=Penaeus semisulcatus majanivirus TaxID=2984274 RepID=A0A9C7BQ43_9VIRU|nr:MAG: hypothetical protein [Penaeus semisulcatus majanivirus]
MPLLTFLYWMLLIMLLYSLVFHVKSKYLKSIHPNSIYGYLELDTIQNMNALPDPAKHAVVEKLIPHLSIPTSLRLIHKYVKDL